MKTQGIKMHFADNSLLDATNPIKVNMIGAGATGSSVLTALMDMNHSMIALGHAGLQVRLWDDDIVTEANLGRQRFAWSELGLYKSVALINHVNRWSGSNWKAEATKFNSTSENRSANIFISCVDNVATRFEIAQVLDEIKGSYHYNDRPLYWMDFGNSKNSGQVVLSTIGDIEQPASKLYETVGKLPFITDEYGELLRQSEEKDDTPSCSLGEALEKQDLYINSTLAQMGSSLLWRLFRNGMTEYRGFFMNLDTYNTQHIKVA